MAHTKGLPKDPPVFRLKELADEAKNDLASNIYIMDNNVNSQFSGLQSPEFKRYVELMGRLQETLIQVSGKMNEISEYCQSVIDWINDYSEV